MHELICFGDVARSAGRSKLLQRGAALGGRILCLRWDSLRNAAPLRAATLRTFWALEMFPSRAFCIALSAARSVATAAPRLDCACAFCKLAAAFWEGALLSAYRTHRRAK